VKKYLPAGSVVLEGGCGRGQLVHALQHQGYKAIGIDFAQETVNQINIAVPEIDVRYGDVRAIDYPDEYLDGYISVGVIEHFWEGYDSISQEMWRTIRTGGFLFISFPYISPVRRLKVFFQRYPIADRHLLEPEQDLFYQFALSLDKVQRDFEKVGFSVREKRFTGGIKGFKDEISIFRPWMQDVFDNKRGKRIKPYLDMLLNPFAAHVAFLVFQKE